MRKAAKGERKLSSGYWFGLFFFVHAELTLRVALREMTDTVCSGGDTVRHNDALTRRKKRSANYAANSRNATRSFARDEVAS